MAGSSNVSSAKRLLGAAAPPGATPPDEVATRAGQLLSELFESLGPVIGRAGVRATFARSARLSGVASPCLVPLLTRLAERQQNEDELATMLVQCLKTQEPTAAHVIAVELFATFFDLMSNFIGDDLLWRIVKRSPPEMDDAGFEETD